MDWLVVCQVWWFGAVVLGVDPAIYGVASLLVAGSQWRYNRTTE